MFVLQLRKVIVEAMKGDSALGSHVTCLLHLMIRDRKSHRENCVDMNCYTGSQLLKIRPRIFLCSALEILRTQNLNYVPHEEQLISDDGAFG